MADTPTDGTSDSTPAKPAPRRRTRTAGTSSAAPVAPVKKRRGPAKKPTTIAAEAVKEAKTVATKAAATARPKIKRATAKVKAAPAASVKPSNRKKLAAGMLVAVVGVAAGVVATVGRKKIATVSGDVMDVVSGKTAEPAAPESLGVPSQSPVPPVS